MNPVLAGHQNCSLEAQISDKFGRQRTRLGHFQHTFSKMVAKQMDAQQFAEKHDCQLAAIVLLAHECSRVPAVLVQSHGLQQITADFANTGTAAVLTGHTKYDIATDKLGIKVLKSSRKRRFSC